MHALPPLRGSREIEREEGNGRRATSHPGTWVFSPRPHDLEGGRVFKIIDQCERVRVCDSFFSMTVVIRAHVSRW